jgi:hypothetical protein
MRGKAKVLTDPSKLKWNLPGSEPQRHWDAVVAGFCMRVYPADARQTGRRAWYVRFDENGKQRFKKIGEWPAIDVTQHAR